MIDKENLDQVIAECSKSFIAALKLHTKDLAKREKAAVVGGLLSAHMSAMFTAIAQTSNAADAKEWLDAVLQAFTIRCQEDSKDKIQVSIQSAVKEKP